MKPDPRFTVATGNTHRASRPPRLFAGFWEKAGGLIAPHDARGEGYWQVATQNGPQIGFCLLFVFCSSWGQTFLLSIFQPHWMQTLSLDAGQMGAIYGGATLASGFLLAWAGRWLDRTSALRAGVVTLAGLAVFSLLAAAVTEAWMLALALFGLRFFGQGLSSNVGMTNAARWFSHNRGKAISLAGLGFPMGEILLPGLVTLVILAAGWRSAWLMLAALLVVVALPLARALVLRHDNTDTDHEAAEARAGGNGSGRRAILRDWRFHAMLGLMAPLPFVGTGVVFFQASIAGERGWNPAVFATGFMVFASVRATCSLSAGAWVDRLGAVRLLPVPPFAFAVGLAFLFAPEPGWAYLFFVGMGVSFGSSGAIMTAAWTELFGVANIGTIRGLSSSVGVFITATAPVVFGLALSQGMPFEGLILGSAGSMMLIAWPLSVAVRRARRR